MVVEPEDVHGSLKAVRAGGGVIAARRDRASRILGVDDVAQVLGQFRPILLGDLVADAPHDHAGMVPLAADHRLQVLGVPLVEEPAVIAGSLALLPAVEGLDHHDEPHSIGQVEQFGAGGLCEVRSALPPISLRISSCRSSARRFSAAPSEPRS